MNFFKFLRRGLAAQKAVDAEIGRQIKDKINRALSEENPLSPWLEHTGHCRVCREVIEAYFAEMPQPHPFCERGRAILEDLKPRTERKQHARQQNSGGA